MAKPESHPTDVATASAAPGVCANCGHADHWHRHDDVACLSEHPQPCSLPGTQDAQRGAPLAPFRCLGYDCERAGPPPRQQCECQNYAEGTNAR